MSSADLCFPKKVTQVTIPFDTVRNLRLGDYTRKKKGINMTRATLAQMMELPNLVNITGHIILGSIFRASLYKAMVSSNLSAE